MWQFGSKSHNYKIWNDIHANVQQYITCSHWNNELVFLHERYIQRVTKMDRSRCSFEQNYLTGCYPLYEYATYTTSTANEVCV